MDWRIKERDPKLGPEQRTQGYLAGTTMAEGSAGDGHTGGLGLTFAITDPA